MRNKWLLKQDSVGSRLYVFIRSFIVAAIITLLSIVGAVVRRSIFGDTRFLISSRLFALASSKRGLKCYGFYLFGLWPLPWLQLTDGKHSFLFKDLPNRRLDESQTVDYSRLPIRRWTGEIADDENIYWRVYRVICVGFSVVAAAEITHRNTLYDVTSYIHPHTRAMFERLSTIIEWPLVSFVIVASNLGASPRKEPGMYLAHVSSLPPFYEHLKPNRGEPRDVAAALASIYADN